MYRENAAPAREDALARQLRQAETELATGDLARAETRLHALGDRHPADERVWALLVEVCLRANKTRKAGRVLLLSARGDAQAEGLRQTFLAHAEGRMPYAWRAVRCAALDPRVEARLERIYGARWRRSDEELRRWELFKVAVLLFVIVCVLRVVSGP